MRFLFLSLLFVGLSVLSGYGQNISPLDFGLGDAKNGMEVYDILVKTHKYAASYGKGVTYEGIHNLTIEIPPRPESIPLSNNTDFAGLSLTVVNKQKDIPLFVMNNRAKSTRVSKKNIKRGNFRNINELRRGYKLLVIKDETPWVNNRKGYRYGAIRHDILLLKNGKAQNTTIQSYMTTESVPVATYYDVDISSKTIKNLHFIRSAQSTRITNFVSLTGQNNVKISDITIETPPSELYGDRAIMINDATNIIVEDVTINGTYSKKDEYGYGVSMNNVYNSRFVRLVANCNWGVFGNNNINTVNIEDSDINRFDIHCYGKDVSCQKTVFRDLYNQFSSFYGKLFFKDCQFKHFVPVLFESTYSAYTFFNLIFEDCSIEVDPKRPYLIRVGKMETAEYAREELSKVEWPNVKICNMSVMLRDSVNKITIFQVGGDGHEMVFGIDSIIMDKVMFKPIEPQINLSNIKIRTQKKVSIIVNNCSFKNIIM